jgi:hypothetical protein
LENTARRCERTQAGRRSIGLQVLFHANYLQLAGG